MSKPTFGYGSAYGLKHHGNVALLWRRFSVSVEACQKAEEKGEKVCTGCGFQWPLAHYTERADRTGGYAPKCRACRNRNLRKRYKGKARPKLIRATCGWCDREGYLIEAMAHGEPATFHESCYQRFLAYEAGEPVRDPVVEEGI